MGRPCCGCMPGGNPGGMPGGAYPGGNPPGGNPGGGGGGIVRPALPAKTPAVAPAPGAAAATDRRCAPSRGHATYLSPAGGSASWGPCACRRADADASPSAPPAVRKRAPWYGLNHAKPMPEPLKLFVPRTFGEVTKAGGNTEGARGMAARKGQCIGRTWWQGRIVSPRPVPCMRLALSCTAVARRRAARL